MDNSDTKQINEQINEQVKEQINEPVKPKTKSKPRCQCCRKKLKMTELNFNCKCGFTFCQLHLNPHSHKCTYDYLSERQEMLKINNPKMCVKVIEVK